MLEFMSLIPLTDEEKKRIIFGLRSSVVATRFLTIKKIFELVEKAPDKLRYLEVSDEAAMRDILNLLEYLASNDTDAVVRREAAISLRAIRNILGPKFKYEVIMCSGCKEMLTFNWKFCPKCGTEVELESLEKEFSKCSNCESLISGKWNYCINCGYQLKKSTLEVRCPNCKKEIKEEWVICPFCGTRLKT